MGPIAESIRQRIQFRELKDKIGITEAEKIEKIKGEKPQGFMDQYIL